MRRVRHPISIVILHDMYPGVKEKPVDANVNIVSNRGFELVRGRGLLIRDQEVR